jgi:hypothetical protein
VDIVRLLKKISNGTSVAQNGDAPLSDTEPAPKRVKNQGLALRLTCCR